MIKKLFFQIAVCLFAVVTLAGCSGAGNFDRQKWAYGDGLAYPLRDQILDDLLQHHHIKGLNFHQVIDSLGSPQRRDPLKFTYQIIDNSFEFANKGNIHKKSLIVYFNKDSVAVRTEVKEIHTKSK